MSNTFYPSWPVSPINAELTPAASLAVNIGDLTYWDAVAHAPKPFSQLADLGTAALMQAAIAAVFLGVSNSARGSADATTTTALRILIEGIWEFPCDSATFEPGDFVGASYNTNILRDQQVAKVSAGYLAIGRVVKRYSSATTKVKCRLMSRYLLGLNGLYGIEANNFGLAVTGSIAAAGSVQGDATAITAASQQVTGADGTKGVLLPIAVAGMKILVANNVASALKVWPNTGAAINGGAANAASSQTASKNALYTAITATNWQAVLSA